MTNCNSSASPSCTKPFKFWSGRSGSEKLILTVSSWPKAALTFNTLKSPKAGISMVSKFSKLSYEDLYDIYLLELDAINHNYDHYFSGDYIKCLKQYEQCSD